MAATHYIVHDTVVNATVIVGTLRNCTRYAEADINRYDILYGDTGRRVEPDNWYKEREVVLGKTLPSKVRLRKRRPQDVVLPQSMVCECTEVLWYLTTHEDEDGRSFSCPACDEEVTHVTL